MENLRALWLGELRLGVAFWDWAVLGALLVNVTSSLLFMVLMTADQPWPALIFGYAFSVPYNFVTLVGVWRSAARHDGPAVHVFLARWTSLSLLTILTMT